MGKTPSFVNQETQLSQVEQVENFINGNYGKRDKDDKKRLKNPPLPIDKNTLDSIIIQENLKDIHLSKIV